MFLEKTKNVICVLKSGGDFDMEYVEHLYKGVLENTTLPFKFYCISDVEGDIPGVHFERPILDLPKWWGKLLIFEMFSSGVYIDLDTVITNNIDPLLSLKEPFIALDNFQPSGSLASGVMVWNEDSSLIFNEFVRTNENYMARFNGDQRFIEFALQRRSKPWKKLQNLLPNFLISYKHHYLFAGLGDESLLIFHGKPRPRDVKSVWSGNYDSRNERKLRFVPFGQELSVDGRVFHDGGIVTSGKPFLVGE